MEKAKTKNKPLCLLSITGAVLLMIGGILLCGALLQQLSISVGLKTGTFILWEAIGIAPIIAGGIWLRKLYRQRDTGMWHKGTLGGTIFGSLLVITGLILFVFNSGIVLHEWQSVIISWQMLLILIGITTLWKTEITLGMILISVGTFFIIPRIENAFPDALNVNPEFSTTYWPILIAITGVAIIIGLISRRSKCNNHGCSNERIQRKNTHRRNQFGTDTEFNNTSGGGFAKTVSDGDGTVNFSMIFSGSEHIFLERVFRGGNISTVFGGMSLDLRRTTLQEGITFLKVEAVFGGIEIKAPEDWSIEIRSNSVFGGFSDSRKLYNDTQDDKSKLVIIADCVFGGGEIQ